MMPTLTMALAMLMLMLMPNVMAKSLVCVCMEVVMKGGSGSESENGEFVFELKEANLIFFRPNQTQIYATNETKLSNLQIKVGDIVSFKMGRNKHKMHKITQVRHDLSWEDVVKNFTKKFHKKIKN